MNYSRSRIIKSHNKIPLNLSYGLSVSIRFTICFSEFIDHIENKDIPRKGNRWTNIVRPKPRQQLKEKLREGPGLQITNPQKNKSNS